MVVPAGCDSSSGRRWHVRGVVPFDGVGGRRRRGGVCVALEEGCVCRKRGESTSLRRARSSVDRVATARDLPLPTGLQCVAAMVTVRSEG